MFQSNQETRDQRRKRQTDEIYVTLGQYVEAFEQLVHVIRGMCILLTSHTPKHEQLMLIVFNYETMTARPLFALYRAFIGQMLNDKNASVSDEERTAIFGALKTFDTDYQVAIDTRNNYLHGTWFIGWGNDQTTDFSEIGFSRFKVRNGGLSQVSGPKSAKEIESLVTECERLRDYFLRLHGCITDHRGPCVSKNFTLDGQTRRWIVRPPAA
jgi:hypothetical protein